MGFGILDPFICGDLLKEDVPKACELIRAAGGIPKISNSKVPNAQYVLGWFPEGQSTAARQELREALMNAYIFGV